jgi:hypothetical protein
MEDSAVHKGTRFGKTAESSVSLIMNEVTTGETSAGNSFNFQRFIFPGFFISSKSSADF